MNKKIERSGLIMKVKINNMYIDGYVVAKAMFNPVTKVKRRKGAAKEALEAALKEWEEAEDAYYDAILRVEDDEYFN